MLNIYAGMSPQNVQAVIDTTADELKKFLAEGISDDEFEKAKIQLKGSFILSQESTVSRMNAIGRNELTLGRVMTEEQVIAKIGATTKADVIEMMRRTIASPMTSFS